LLALRTIPGLDAFDVLVSGKDVPDRKKGSTYPAKLIFDGANPMGSSATAGSAMSTGPALRFFGLEPALLDRFAAAKTIGVGNVSRSFADFEVPKAGAAITALRKCVAEQLIEWGADPAQFAPGGSLPVPFRQREDWLTNDQLLKLSDGTSTIDYLYVVTIAPDGTVESCRRERAGADDKAEKLGCTPLIGQKLFKPATSPAGTPVRGVLTSRVMLSTAVITEVVR